MVLPHSSPGAACTRRYGTGEACLVQRGSLFGVRAPQARQTLKAERKRAVR